MSKDWRLTIQKVAIFTIQKISGQLLFPAFTVRVESSPSERGLYKLSAK